MEFPDVFDKVLQIEQGISPDIPNSGFIIAKNFPTPLQKSIVETLLSFVADPASPEFSVLNVLQPGLDGLTETDQSLYHGIKQLLADAGMTPEEVWDNYMR